MTALTITIAALLAAHLTMILSEQLPVWRAANRELLELEAEHGPAWIWEAEVGVLCAGLDLVRMGCELKSPEMVGLARDRMFFALDELASERERGKAEAGRRLAT